MRISFEVSSVAATKLPSGWWPLCMLNVKDPRGYGHQHTSLATVVFNLVPEVVP